MSPTCLTDNPEAVSAGPQGEHMYDRPPIDTLKSALREALYGERNTTLPATSDMPDAMMRALQRLQQQDENKSISNK